MEQYAYGLKGTNYYTQCLENTHPAIITYNPRIYYISTAEYSTDDTMQSAAFAPLIILWSGKDEKQKKSYDVKNISFYVDHIAGIQ